MFLRKVKNGERNEFKIHLDKFSKKSKLTYGIKAVEKKQTQSGEHETIYFWKLNLSTGKAQQQGEKEHPFHKMKVKEGDFVSLFVDGNTIWYKINTQEYPVCFTDDMLT